MAAASQRAAPSRVKGWRRRGGAASVECHRYWLSRRVGAARRSPTLYSGRIARAALPDHGYGTMSPPSNSTDTDNGTTRLPVIVVLPNEDVIVERVEFGDELVVVARICRSDARCPTCGVASTRPRSRYCRSVADLSAQGIPVRLKLWVRRFACDHDGCAQRIFTEQLPTLVASHARRTVRLSETLFEAGLALGGEAAARLLATFGITASADTVLRRVRRAPLPDRPTPRVLGVDEWARRRGRTYGIILVDLERNTAVDLLDSREADALAAWLTSHPGVKVIASDRSEAFADGARRGAPRAVQIVDRWHLF